VFGALGYVLAPQIGGTTQWRRFPASGPESATRGDHIPLCFVTTCDNGVFSGGVFMHLSIYFPALFVDIKLL